MSTMMEPSKGKTKISGKYRVSQPIRNFKIRIKIVQQKSLLAELFDNEGETRDGNFLESEEYEFRWQEKVFGPYEAKYYREARNCVTDRQKEYHRRLTEDEADSEGSRLYSYVQGDSYYPEQSLLTGSFRSCLAERNESAAPPVRNRKPFAERHNKRVIDEKPSDRRIQENHYLYTERESMYIVVDLSPKDEASASTDSEALLCALVYDRQHGCLTVSPDFAGDECYSVDGIGMSYDFWIEHVSQRPSSRELQRRRDLAKREMQRLRTVKESQLFHELLSAQPHVLRVYVNLDVGAAWDFGYDDALFVSYFVDLPRHWRHQAGQGSRRRLAGRTQRCRARNGRANFGYCAEILLDLDLGALTSEQELTGIASWPNVLISVASLDSWTRYRIEGYGSFPLPSTPGTFDLELKTWRPAGGFIDSLRRFFTGGTRELDDITYCAVPAMHEGSLLDKSGLRVVPSGVVELRLNVAHQSQSFAGQRNFTRDYERLNAGKLLNSVDDVLSQFKAARERMIQARALCS